MKPRRIVVTADRRDYAKSLLGDYANHTHYGRAYEDDVELVTPDGSLIGRLFSGALDDDVLAPAHKLIRSIKTPITRRGNVVAPDSMLPRIDADGTVSKFREVPPAARKLVGFSDTIGYLGPSALFPHGRLTRYTKGHPQARQSLIPVLWAIDALFRDAYPGEYAWQTEAYPTDDVYNWYGRVGDESAFSSCYGNNMVRSAYHRDPNNLSGGLSALFTTGDYTGGGLVLPQYGVCINLQPGDLLLFHPEVIHGVLPFTGERNSGVFFSASRWPTFAEQVGLDEPATEDEDRPDPNHP
jgi:hypothetical protein